jgi:hypothetical protein
MNTAKIFVIDDTIIHGQDPLRVRKHRSFDRLEATLRITRKEDGNGGRRLTWHPSSANTFQNQPYDLSVKTKMELWWSFDENDAFRKETEVATLFVLASTPGEYRSQLTQFTNKEKRIAYRIYINSILNDDVKVFL